MPAPPIVGQRYELSQVVGQGGCGIVYRALDRQTQLTVAVKVLSRTAAADPSMVERLVREQEIMRALAGTNAVRVIDLCEASNGALCLVMEWLEGVDLERHLTELERAGRRMSVERLVEVVAPVVATLQRAHAIEIVHRDLKPANVFLVTGPVPGTRLLDFGLARMKSSAPLTAIGTVMGSPSYIPPEAWRGKSREVDHRGDLYSLAVIVFRILSGHLPFSAPNLLEQLELVTRAKRPSLRALRPDLPADIDNWIEQALAIEPSGRFNTARGMFTALLLSLDRSAAEIQAALSTIEPELSVAERKNALSTAWDAAKSLLGRLTRKPTSPSLSPEGTSLPPLLPTLPVPGSPSLAAQPSSAAPLLEGAPVERHRVGESPLGPPPRRPAPAPGAARWARPGPLTLARIPEIEADLVPLDEAPAPAPTAPAPTAPAPTAPAPTAPEPTAPEPAAPAPTAPEPAAPEPAAPEPAAKPRPSRPKAGKPKAGKPRAGKPKAGKPAARRPAAKPARERAAKPKEKKGRRRG